mmetsp:Transcript_53094/g.140114  ORF Transcript_53094/g.140114 Transcript_53094/m.140114 type:complete len:293 (+) Transcript_53094:1031-1909(+)
MKPSLTTSSMATRNFTGCREARAPKARTQTSKSRRHLAARNNVPLFPQSESLSRSEMTKSLSTESRVGSCIWKLVSEKRCTPSCISQEIILPLKSSLQIRSVHLLPSSKVGLSFRVRLSRNNLEISRATDIFFFNEPSVCSAELENVLLATNSVPEKESGARSSSYTHSIAGPSGRVRRCSSSWSTWLSGRASIIGGTFLAVGAQVGYSREAVTISCTCAWASAFGVFTCRCRTTLFRTKFLGQLFVVTWGPIGPIPSSPDRPEAFELTKGQPTPPAKTRAATSCRKTPAAA